MSIFFVFIYLMAIVAAVMVWRGIWGLLDVYLWPQNPKLSYWISALIGLILFTTFLIWLPRGV